LSDTIQGTAVSRIIKRGLKIFHNSRR